MSRIADKITVKFECSILVQWLFPDSTDSFICYSFW